jgi:hypothetical protein
MHVDLADRWSFGSGRAMLGQIQSPVSRQVSNNDARGVSFSDLFIGEFYHLT